VRYNNKGKISKSNIIDVIILSHELSIKINPKQKYRMIKTKKSITKNLRNMKKKSLEVVLDSLSKKESINRSKFLFLNFKL